jgi:tRNA pseudouridine32 synthase/23S rRNA pseudouridine746 synthase
MFDIVHQNDDFIVINKYPNVSVHKDDGDTILVNQVALRLGIEKLYLVHRLDKMTSGLLLLATNRDSASQISSLFANRHIEKYYLAIGSKKPKKKQGLIAGDMARSRRSSWKLLTSKKNPAITQFFSLAGDIGERLFLCKPHTGKTHQIRVALNSIGSAIVGDPIYNVSSQSDRGYLHAYALCFQYLKQDYRFILVPRQGEKWATEATKQALVQWQSPWDLTWPTVK